MLQAKECGKNSNHNERKSRQAPWKQLGYCGSKDDKTFQKWNGEKMRNISGGTRKMKKQQTINNSTHTHTKTLVSYMLIHTVVQQEPTQHWKETILQFRNKV